MKTFPVPSIDQTAIIICIFKKKELSRYLNFPIKCVEKIHGKDGRYIYVYIPLIIR